VQVGAHVRHSHTEVIVDEVWIDPREISGAIITVVSGGDLAARMGGTTRLGSYEIVRKLARGGMAELFLAKSLGPQGFEKLVVLKKILPQYAANQRFVRLFLDEARLAAGFQHPNIAHVFDMGTVDGNYFFAMEFVHGQDVRSTLHRGWEQKRLIPIDLCVQIARAVASALHYAHEQRKPDGSLLDIVHRDVSPSNVMLSYDGTVKLLDFGVAKAQSSSSKTRTGTLKGKVSYMSPEQAKGAPIDRRSDVFSLGIVLWEMITGTRLFRGENDLATIQMIINQPAASPSSYRSECPPELEKIIARALATDPAQRIQTAQQFQIELEELAREQKLNQSPFALGKYLGELFEREIAQWKDAQSAGQTLGDHIGELSGNGDSLTTPVSEADLSIFSAEIEEPDDDDFEDDGEDATESADIAMIDGIPQLVVHSAPPPKRPDGAQDPKLAPRAGTLGAPAVRQKIKTPAQGADQTGDAPETIANRPSARLATASPAPAKPSAPPLPPGERAIGGDATMTPTPKFNGLVPQANATAAALFPNLPNIALAVDPDTGEPATVPYLPEEIPSETITGPPPVALGTGPEITGPLPLAMGPHADRPPSRPSGPIPAIPRNDATPIPTSFPVLSREQWTRQLNIPLDEPPPDFEVELARKRLKTAMIVIGCVLVLAIISIVASGGDKPAPQTTPEPEYVKPSDQVRFESDGPGSAAAGATPGSGSATSDGASPASGSGTEPGTERRDGRADGSGGSAGSAPPTAGSGSSVGSGSAKKKTTRPRPKIDLNSPFAPK